MSEFIYCGLGSQRSPGAIYRRKNKAICRLCTSHRSRDIIHSRGGISVVHVRKQANKVAHQMARIPALWKAANNDDVEDEIFLCNPMTREIKRLPRASNILIPRIFVQNCLLGFGYDHVNDDYKVMRTCHYPDHIVVSVYSLKNNSWARAENMSTSISLYRNFGASSNGSLYWIAEGNVVAYDLVVHRHRELQFPAGVDKKNAKFLWQFNRSLCLIECCPDSRWDIWVMNIDGVKKSWSKLLSLEQSGVLGSFQHVYPVAFSKAQNEILLVVDRKRLVWYDRESNKVKNIAHCGFPESFELFDYNERHFKISDSILDGRQSEEEERKQREHALRDFFQEGGFKPEHLTTEKDIKYAVEKAMERAKKSNGSSG
ncbi:hypothetical protein AgCh_027322 [Apium graveolens]